MTTTGLKNDDENHDGFDVKGEEASKFSAIVARADYLAQYRSDIGVSVNELCRIRSTPRRGAWAYLKRLARYLVDKRRPTVIYASQEGHRGVDVWVDTYYAG